MRLPLLLAAAIASLGAATPPPVAVVDLATPFLAAARTTTTPEGLAWALVQHEDAHWAVVGPLAYAEGADAKARLAHARYYARDRARVLADVGALGRAVGPAVRAIAPRVGTLMGATPHATVYAAPLLAGSNAWTIPHAGSTAVVLNALDPGLRGEEALAGVLAHELTHVAQGRRTAGRDAALGPLWRGLYREGGATFAATRLVPALDERRHLFFGPAPYAEARAKRGAAARAFLAATRAPAATHRAAEARFFTGNHQPPGLPPRVGYDLGLAVYRRIAVDLGPTAAVRLGPAAFLPRAKAALEALARTPG